MIPRQHGLLGPMLLACLCAAAGAAHAQTTVANALSRANRLPPIPARLLVQAPDAESELLVEVTLLGREGDALLAQGRTAGTPFSRIEKSRVRRCEFTLEYDLSAVAQALQKSDWGAAVRILSPVVRLALPYLDLPENNGLEPAMDLGMYMVASADREKRGAAPNADRARALKQYAAACEVFRQAARAQWSPLASLAALKRCRALLAQGLADKVSEALEEVGEPDPGDLAYGHYWLARAEGLRHAGKTREALEAVVKSVVFADQDVETFPSALLLSAHCYRDLKNAHRARDLYYEVAVLFVGTDWADEALEGLREVMAGNQTLQPEKTPLENVFFNVADDMNKLAAELIEARAPTPTNAVPETKKE